jgi:prepilin-type N-terminal cleavage/methylation domain-containing protein
MDMRYRQRGFSLVEILVVTAIVGVIVAIGLPALRSGHLGVSAPEATAVREMQLVVRAQTQHQAQFGKYAASLNELGPHAEKDSYLFAMVLTRTGYALLASPRIYLFDGRRTFYVNQSGVVHESRGDRPASADSPVFR